MQVLLDTSVWVDFFKTHHRVSTALVEELLVQGRVVTCKPIFTEILSASLTLPVQKTIRDSFRALDFIDPDWNSDETWKKIVELAQFCRQHKCGMPGMTDRMILASALENKAQIWTLDRKLEKLARLKGVCFSES